jgi:hypothetical protein
MARKVARPAVAAGLAGSLAAGIAAPVLVHHEETVEPAVAEVNEVTEAVYPAFTAEPWPAFEPLTYNPFALEKVHHGPHGHLPHYGLIEYEYKDLTAPIITTASGSPGATMTMFNLHLGQAI